jgi:LPS export ABC transporter protein LptC
MNSANINHKIFYIAALFTGCFFVLGCENDERQIKELTEAKTMIEEAKDIESYLSQNGEMKAKLKAPLMLRVMADTLYIEFPKTLHIDFFDTTKAVQSWVDAKYGKYYENHNKAFLRDSVVVINTTGDTLKCPDLWWDQNRQIFYTDQYAQYHSKDRQIYGGKGMEASQDLKTIIFKQPTGTVKVSESGFPE